MGRRLCWLSPCSVFNGCSPLPSSHRAKGGRGQGVSPALRSSSYRGSRKSLYFPHSLRQQKRMLEKRSSRGNCKDKGTGKVSRANRLSSEPPQAGRPGALLAVPQLFLQAPDPNSVPGRWDNTPGPITPLLGSLSGLPLWPHQGLACCLEGPGEWDIQAWAADGRPRGREQSCQVMSCCLASFSRSFNVHSSRISESSQYQLSSDLFLHGGRYDHQGHLTSGSRPGFFWQSQMIHMLFHLNGNSEGS